VLLVFLVVYLLHFEHSPLGFCILTHHKGVSNVF
jgi:hypothetical protein